MRLLRAARNDGRHNVISVIAREPATAAIPKLQEGLKLVCKDFSFPSSYKYMNRQTFYIYILTNKYNRVLYTGITNDLVRRVNEHRFSNKGFTGKYKVKKLVYFEEYDSSEAAIDREKQIKAGSRRNKIDLIEELNPGWRDLYEYVVGWHE